MIFQNQHIITGNLAADARLDTTATGKRVVHLRVITEFQTNFKGKSTTTTTGHSVTAWGTMAENIAHWRKGDLVHIEGPVFEREFKPADGSKPRKVRELYADVAFRVDTGRQQEGQASAQLGSTEEASLAASVPHGWPV